MLNALFQGLTLSTTVYVLDNPSHRIRVALLNPLENVLAEDLAVAINRKGPLAEISAFPLIVPAKDLETWLRHALKVGLPTITY